MLVKDVVTGKNVDSEYCIKAVIDHDEKGITTGYTKETGATVNAIIYQLQGSGRGSIYPVVYEKMKDKLFFSNRQGTYISSINVSPSFMTQEIYTLGRGIFPYTFSRRYEAIENFDTFKGRQQILSNTNFPLSKYLKYTFGLEFETSEGIIPENICFRDGLIPLRDGSITGIEYSTVVLKGNDGLNLLSQQLQTLETYTRFNKECSLHIHFGGFPITKKAIFNLYNICYSLQNEGDFTNILPPLTFKTSAYKNSGKDYCRVLPLFETFEDFYYSMVGKSYFGSLVQPHPNDPNRERKWNIPTRYYWVNFINSLCYNVNKTIEFRFLRPTYNLRKILVWMYILNAILVTAEKNKNYSSLDIILENVYPKDVAEKIKLEILKLRISVSSQVRNSNDKIGGDINIEEKLFPRNEII